MKVITSTVPVADDVKKALSTKEGRESLVDFINQRAAGKADYFNLKLGAGDKFVELTAEPPDASAELPTPIV
jgi:hypothetical protein